MSTEAARTNYGSAPGDPRRVAGPAALALLLLAFVFVWAASWTGPDRDSALLDAIYVLATSLPRAALWLGAAAGLGVAARWLVRSWVPLDGLLQLTIGVALLLILDAALGALGILQMGGQTVAGWIFTGIAFIPLLIALTRRARERLQLHIRAPWMHVATVPTIAIVILAACSAPGWLWATEFGGYDVLSYHLQLPREWYDAGRIVPLDHNVYSFLPGYMEAAYYHLMVLRGDPHEAIYACQLLHASLAIITAAACARVVRQLLEHVSAHAELHSFTAAITLGTPWVVVVGTLAYNEVPTVLILAVGLSLALERRGSTVARAAVLGVLLAAAIGAKPTAAGFTALPLVLIWIWRQPKRLISMFTIGGVALMALLPWLLRNMIHSGNPLFPFLTDLLGSAHFTPQQVSIWNAGHQSDLSLLGRWREAFNQLLWYGLGANPDPTGRDPWQPQWSILPWLALAGCALGTTAPKLRRPALLALFIIVVQFAFWVTFTHIKSRFMLPMVVPASIGATIGLLRVLQLLRFSPDCCWHIGRIILTAVALLYCAQPALLYRVQQDGAPSARIGWVGLLTGEELTPADRASIGDVVPSVKVNYGLPNDARVLLVGDAAPLYYTADITYTTTWDRGPMSDVLSEHPDDPSAWPKALSARDYTHVLLQPTMLQLWQAEGWANPALDPQRLRAAFEQHSAVVTRFPDGSMLYRLP